MMTDLWRKVCAKFGRRYVVLTFHDDRLAVRPVWFLGETAMASAFGRGFGDAVLLDGGAIGGPSYLTAWRPYDPFLPKSARRWPTPPVEVAE